MQLKMLRLMVKMAQCWALSAVLTLLLPLCGVAPHSSAHLDSSPQLMTNCGVLSGLGLTQSLVFVSIAVTVGTAGPYLNCFYPSCFGGVGFTYYARRHSFAFYGRAWINNKSNNWNGINMLTHSHCDIMSLLLLLELFFMKSWKPWPICLDLSCNLTLAFWRWSTFIAITF